MRSLAAFPVWGKIKSGMWNFAPVATYCQTIEKPAGPVRPARAGAGAPSAVIPRGRNPFSITSSTMRNNSRKTEKSAFQHQRVSRYIKIHTAKKHKKNSTLEKKNHWEFQHFSEQHCGERFGGGKFRRTVDYRSHYNYRTIGEEVECGPSTRTTVLRRRVCGNGV